MEALIHYFKLYTEEVRVPSGQVYAAVEAPKASSASTSRPTDQQALQVQNSRAGLRPPVGRWNSSARATCWPTSPPFSARSTSCSARWTDEGGGPQLGASKSPASGVFAGALGARTDRAAGRSRRALKLSSAWSHRGFAPCRMPCRCAAYSRNATLPCGLNEDAQFAFPYGDGYWTLLLDRKYRYEADIELFFSRRCGGRLHADRWRRQLRLLVGARNLQAVWRHRAIAIEPSSQNFSQARPQREDQRQPLQADALRDRREGGRRDALGRPSTRR